MIEELREGLGGLAAAEPVNTELARRAVQARADTTRRSRRLATAMLALAAVVVIVAGVALFRPRSGSVRVTTPTPLVSPTRPPRSTVPTTTPTITTVEAPATTVPAVVAPSTTVGSASKPGSVAVPVDLVFTGRYPGHVVTARRANSGLIVGPHDGRPSLPACTNFWPPDPGGAVLGVEGVLAGHPFILGYDGVVSNFGQGLSEGALIIGEDPLNYNDALGFDPKSLVFDHDLLGARIDSDLYSHSKAGVPSVVGHVTGHFRCAP